jgi:hypothetical protein
MDEPETVTGFVVWITPSAEGRVAGTVERVRTGERHRFQDLETLGALIARMLSRPEPTVTPPAAPEPQTGSPPHHHPTTP